jgi:hypothetical protein
VILLVAFAVVVATVPLFGGRIGRLVEIPIRHSWLVLLACAVQTVLISVVAGVGERIGNAVHLATYALAGLFMVVNHRLPGVKLLALGGASNLVAIVANGGVMPASAWATRVAGMSAVAEAGQFANSRLVEHPRLLLFGDVMAVPSSLPLSNVFSIGDVILVAGAFVLLHQASGSSALRQRASNAGERTSITIPA